MASTLGLRRAAGGNDVAYDANSVKDNACRPAMSNGSASDQFRSVSPCVLSRTASLHPDVGPSEANRAGRGVAFAPFRVRDSEPWALTPLRGILSDLVAKARAGDCAARGGRGIVGPLNADVMNTARDV